MVYVNKKAAEKVANRLNSMTQVFLRDLPEFLPKNICPAGMEVERALKRLRTPGSRAEGWEYISHRNSTQPQELTRFSRENDLPCGRI